MIFQIRKVIFLLILNLSGERGCKYYYFQIRMRRIAALNQYVSHDKDTKIIICLPQNHIPHLLPSYKTFVFQNSALKARYYNQRQIKDIQI